MLLIDRVLPENKFTKEYYEPFAKHFTGMDQIRGLYYMEYVQYAPHGGKIFWYDDKLAAQAGEITVPVEFLLQWNDQHIPRESGLRLFDAFASAEKSLHVNSGAHKEVPRFEVDSMVRFFQRHLTKDVKK